MQGIEEQIELEKRMTANGIIRYKHIMNDANEHGRGSENRYATTLIRELVSPVSASIQEFCKEKRAGFASKYKVVLREIDPDKVAYIGLKALFNHYTQNTGVHKLANNIGTMLEDELKFTKFQEKHGDYYDAIIKDFRRKGTSNYRHMHRVLTFKANEKNVLWKDWGVETRISVGMKVIDCIHQSTDLINLVKKVERKKKVTLIEPSTAAINWIQEFHKNAEIMNPDKLPCVVKPDDWVDITNGGYYTPQLRTRTPLVKTRSKEHIAMFEGDISNITDTVNIIQGVAWQLNKDVYDVIKVVWDRSLSIGLPQSEPYIVPDSPVKGKSKKEFSKKDEEAFTAWKEEARLVHIMERERVSKGFQVVRVLSTAADYSNMERFWFVYQCDFRGRIYCTVNGLSPQGPDFAKALLRFADGKPLGKRGAFWLKVHGANCFGEDKVSYDNRVKWVEANEKYILECANDALSMRDFWGNADKPYQFLAFCFEYSRFKKEGYKMLTYLPISLDGSCNGLQNFSAILRDPIGGKATNLIPSDKPCDIYAEVSKVCTRKIREQKLGEEAQLWLNYINKLSDRILPRGISKRPVMTLPYGSTRQSCREYIYRYMVEELSDAFPREKMFKLSVWLTPLMWSAISEVVVAARTGMDWLQKAASTIAKTNRPIIWWTPIGFPVYQGTRKVRIRQVKTQLNGMYQVRIGDKIGPMDVSKNKLGISPNFVHSLDACHLMMTCNLAYEYGITSFAFIHDDFGTHACDTDVLHQAIREAFVILYDDNKPLIDFKIFNEDNANLKLIDLPQEGSLKIGQIIDSDYFFG